jgi:hypothetical protein
MVLKVLSQCMDLPLQQVLHEAQKKLIGTFCVVDGKLMHIQEITEDYIQGYVHLEGKHNQLKLIEDPKEINFWLPDAGIYQFKNNFVWLKKLPKKQWKKSFSWDFYTVESKSYTSQFNEFAYTIFKEQQLPCDFYVTGSKIFYLNRQIGTVTPSGILKLLDGYFEQEIKDLMVKDPLWTLKYKLSKTSFPTSLQNSMKDLQVISH